MNDVSDSDRISIGGTPPPLGNNQGPDPKYDDARALVDILEIDGEWGCIDVGDKVNANRTGTVLHGYVRRSGEKFKIRTRTEEKGDTVVLWIRKTPARGGKVSARTSNGERLKITERIQIGGEPPDSIKFRTSTKHRYVSYLINSLDLDVWGRINGYSFDEKDDARRSAYRNRKNYKVETRTHKEDDGTYTLWIRKTSLDAEQAS